jgi:hypothetical protein
MSKHESPLAQAKEARRLEWRVFADQSEIILCPFDLQSNFVLQKKQSDHRAETAHFENIKLRTSGIECRHYSLVFACADVLRWHTSPAAIVAQGFVHLSIPLAFSQMSLYKIVRSVV